jgi:hypothetical protein
MIYHNVYVMIDLLIGVTVVLIIILGVGLGVYTYAESIFSPDTLQLLRAMWGMWSRRNDPAPPTAPTYTTSYVDGVLTRS